MNSTAPVFLRRLGPDPHQDGAKTVACDGCPDLWELDDGNIAVIGIRITDKIRGKLPLSAGCSPDEEVIMLPRSLILAAKADIAGLQ